VVLSVTIRPAGLLSRCLSIPRRPVVANGLDHDLCIQRPVEPLISCGFLRPDASGSRLGADDFTPVDPSGRVHRAAHG